MILETFDELCVLVVDDHAGMRKIIHTVLNQLGIGVILEAEDGVKGLEILCEHNQPQKVTFQNPPQQEVRLVICDWMMPRMNGLELLRAVRAVPDWKQLPFIMLTAENEREQIVAAIELKVSDYIVKPFSALVLEQKIQSLFPKLNKVK